eukprot:TRINITY_DN1321_c0_g1_i1.p1 TRINITY_DN1321_c0_g1~~TRINITY_DN1321_c0_g1_i1.p1  ORF type:complete len:1228 (+),score=315.72 TRINITY_DN1321_c0_g1_i1:46-3729(+)
MAVKGLGSFWDIPGMKPGVITGDVAWALLAFAKEKGFAIPAFNCTSTSTINAVLEAGKKLNRPVIIQFSEGGAAFMAGKSLDNKQKQASVLGAVAGAQYVRGVAPAYGIPVLVHSDHCAKKLLPWFDGMLDFDEDFFRTYGEPLFSSHMLDLSEEPHEENIAICREYLQRMAKVNLILEMEIGITGGVEDGVDNTGASKDKLYSTPEEVWQVYEALSPISEKFTIAAAFGNVHGVYKPGNVVLKPELLDDFQKYAEKKLGKVKPLFFVFHGGSGSEKEKIDAARSYGVVKMNVDTDTQWAYWDGLRKFYQSSSGYLQGQIGNPDGDDKPNKSYYDPRKWVRQAELSMIDRVKESCKDLQNVCHVVVVGWGPVGHTLLSKLLEKGDGNFACTVISEEPYPAYNRVKLTSFFKHRDPNAISLTTLEWCNQNGVELVFGKASNIDRQNKMVEVCKSKGGKVTVSYDELVLATGSKPFVPPTPGLDVAVAGIFVYRTINDLFAITERAKTAKKAAIIGGGLLGLEAAKAAHDLKLETHILEMAPHLMPVQLDAEAGGMLKAKVEALGPIVHTGIKILEILSGPSGVTGVKIIEGGAETVLEVDLLICSAGVRPRQELAEGCGLELGGRGGVKVDGQMQSTSDPNVWAVGEIASYNGGMCYQLSAPGYTQAEILASKLVNPKSTATFTGADLSTKLKLLGVDVASFGGHSDFWFKRHYMSDDTSVVQNQVSKDASKGIYKKLVFSPDGSRLLGGILVGDISAYTKLTAVSKRPDLGGVTPAELMAGKMPRVDDGGDGTNLGDDDDVCNCHQVKKKVIREAIKKGAHDFDAIKRCTKAGTGCGSCIATGPQPGLLAHTLNKLGVKKGVCPSLPFSLDDIEDLAKGRKLTTYEELLANIGYAPAAAPTDKAALGSLLDRISGKPKGDGMDHIQQLRALNADLWKFVDKVNCNPILLRLAWHDAGTFDKTKTGFPAMGGANGSIIFNPEINHGANNGLNKAVKYLEPFKADYPLVSWADLIQMAGAVGIEHAGGPKVDMKYGRKDASGPEACPGRTSRGTADNAGLPDAEAPYACGAKDPATHLRNIFNRMGFDDRDIVALSGAHTIGRAFKERSGVVSEGYGEANGCPYTKSVPSGCPIRHDGKGGVGMPGGKSWTTKWLKFDNEYFQEHVYKETDPNLLWASTDRALHQDPEFRKFFMLYKDDQSAFFKDFASAMKRLSELGSQWEPAEGIVL